MNKENWIRHMENTESIVRPSKGGDRNTWLGHRIAHQGFGCKVCRQREGTRKANSTARERDSIRRELCGTSARQAKIDMGI